MSTLSKETKITFVIEAICTIKKMSIRQAVKIYDLFESSFCDRMKSMTLLTERCNSRYQLIPIEEKTFLQYIFDLDSRGFIPRIDGVEDMANIFFAMCSIERVGVRWIYRFVYQRPKLKICLSRSYDF